MNLSTPALLCVVLLAACSGPDSSTPEGQCQREAYQDPAVKDLIAKGTSGGGELQADLQRQRDYTIKSAVNRCLAARGAIRSGGVERLR